MSIWSEPSDRDIKDREELPEDIAVPLLEASQGESRESIQDLYAALLANAMDSRFAGDVRPEFIEIVKQLQPIDAVVLEFARGRYIEPSRRIFNNKDASKR
ncbi:Abi-alpha family protein [Bradyrhizobium sp. USDA 4471]